MVCVCALNEFRAKPSGGVPHQNPSRVLLLTRGWSCPANAPETGDDAWLAVKVSETGCLPRERCSAAGLLESFDC